MFPAIEEKTNKDSVNDLNLNDPYLISAVEQAQARKKVSDPFESMYDEDIEDETSFWGLAAKAYTAGIVFFVIVGTTFYFW